MHMKKLLHLFFTAAFVITSLTGCVAAIGNRDTGLNKGTTLGQQLIDLQKAKEANALSESEYQEQRARLLKK